MSHPSPAQHPQPEQSAQPAESVWRLPGLLPLVGMTVMGFGGFATLMSVVPLWVVRGGATETGSGLVTSSLLITTVITQTFVPRLLRRFGHAVVLSAGLIALGLPSFGFALSSDLAPVLALSAVRGIGFGILTVTGSAVVADLAPPARRGAAIGAYGLGIAVPNLIFLPLSVLVVDAVGFTPVFVAGAMPLLGIPAAVVLGRIVRSHRAAPRQPTTRPSNGRRRQDVLRLMLPAGVLLSVTLAGGALITFLPQLVSGAGWPRSGFLASIGLLVLNGIGALTRWLIGGVADRRGAGRLMIPLLVLGAIGMVLLAVSLHRSNVAVLLIGLGLVGCAYGALQNLTLLSAFQQVDRSRTDTASAVWNIGFDSGTAIGSTLLGFIATQAGFVPGVIVLGLLMLAALPAAWRLAIHPQPPGLAVRNDR
ncbi:MFS transporter [Microlunatus elymi]|uniref:MFS transporter n=1 Tax=Microlunatus elymi TaxID=2596828 RepID=A0A516PYJ2_9ACTN|nr:MFS transporter [Microlunatus elymi]QDP96238.1 MFS transporter [Microlunatus elymi]